MTRENALAISRISAEPDSHARRDRLGRAMAEPTVIDIRHSLGRDEARRRIAARAGDLPRHVPGGMATITSSWPTPDRMAMTVSAMGQDIPCTLDVGEDVIRVSILLSGMLAMMAAPITAIVRSRAADLLLEDRSGPAA